MAIVTPRPDVSRTAQTNESYRAPHRTLQANTRSIKDMVTRPGGDGGAPTTTEITASATPETAKDPKSVPINTTVETKSPEAVTLSPQLTALARKEQAFRKQEQAFKAKEQEFKANQTAFEAKQAEYAGYAKLKESLTAKDYSILDELGVSYEEWTNYLLSKGEGATPENQALAELRNELKSVKDKQAESETKQKEAVDKQYEATVNQYRKEIQSLIASDPSFETVKELKAEEHVLQHILDTFNEDGEVLTVSDAAQEVEEKLLEDALAMARLKKVQDKIKPVETASADSQKKILPPPSASKQAIKTLTNEVAPASTKTYPQFQHLSPKERIAQAIAKSQRQS